MHFYVYLKIMNVRFWHKADEMQANVLYERDADLSDSAIRKGIFVTEAVG